MYLKIKRNNLHFFKNNSFSMGWSLEGFHPSGWQVSLFVCFIVPFLLTSMIHKFTGSSDTVRLTWNHKKSSINVMLTTQSRFKSYVLQQNIKLFPKDLIIGLCYYYPKSPMAYFSEFERYKIKAYFLYSQLK